MAPRLPETWPIRPGSRAPPTIVDRFFEAYVESCNGALGESPDFEAARVHFADCFLAVTSQGVRCGQNDERFLQTLREGYGYFRAVGARRLSLRKVESTPIDPGHVMAKAFFHTDYKDLSGARLSHDFDVTYLVDVTTETPRIFAFILNERAGP